jgi:hypothetical protein
MRTTIIFVAALVLAACGPRTTETPTPSASESASGVSVTNPWAPPSPAGVDVAAGYVTLRNNEDAEDQLLSASSPRATSVEIHEMTMDGAVMRMRAMPSLPIPAHGEVTLAPGGMHLMFIGVAQPFAVDEQIPVTLTFANAGQVELVLSVRPASAGGGMH